MRKKLIIAALLVILASLFAYGTAAYLTAEKTAHNIISAGSIDIELLDKTRPSDKPDAPIGELPDFPAAGLTVMPGTTASKLVAVQKPQSSADCYVRVRLEQLITLSGQNPRPAAANDPITLDIDEQHWLRGTDQNGGWDGWYYYTVPLTADAPLSLPLLSSVHFKPTMGNDYQGATYLINVQAQAVQLANNPIPDGGDVTGISGWPAVQD